MPNPRFPEGRIISYKTYVDFAKKYKIKINKKTMSQLSNEIYNYETRHKVKKGLYYLP
jgi:hypothetical protein